MRKNRLLSLLLAAVMTAAAALSLASCSSDNDNNDNSGNSNNPSQQYNVAGTWMAEYDVMGTVGGSQMEYSRLRTACTFNNDGTGTWYKFMLDEGSNEPIALDGGAEHGDYTYSVGADGKIACRLTWSHAPSYYPSTLSFAAGGDSIKGQEGGAVTYGMKRASDDMKAWIAQWTGRLNGGGNSDASSGAGAKIAAAKGDVGKVIGTDGKIYRDVAAATSAGTVATAMIAYVGSETGDATYNHGLAIALSNEANEMSLSAARDICEKKAKYVGAKWCVPNDEQWLQMFSTNGGDIESIVGLNEALTAACGTGIPDGFYWSSTVGSNYNVGLMLFDDGYVTIAHAKKTYWGFLCRACLVF